MVPLCPECSKFGEPAKLTLKGKKLICEGCGFVYPGEFEEADGMLVSKGRIELTPKPDSTMYVKIVNNNDPGRTSYGTVNSFPLSPFKNGKKVTGYKIIVDYELRAFYGKTYVLGWCEEDWAPKRRRLDRV